MSPRPNRMETPLQLLVEKDQELVRRKRRRAALKIIEMSGYEDSPELRETLAMLGLLDPALSS